MKKFKERSTGNTSQNKTRFSQQETPNCVEMSRNRNGYVAITMQTKVREHDCMAIATKSAFRKYIVVHDVVV